MLLSSAVCERQNITQQKDKPCFCLMGRLTLYMNMQFDTVHVIIVNSVQQTPSSAVGSFPDSQGIVRFYSNLNHDTLITTLQRSKYTL